VPILHINVTAIRDDSGRRLTVQEVLHICCVALWKYYYYYLYLHGALVRYIILRMILILFPILRVRKRKESQASRGFTVELVADLEMGRRPMSESATNFLTCTPAGS
jgi:uncharacterized membrane protein